MKFSNILFLCLLVLLALISCSEAGRRNKGVRKGGKGKNGVRKVRGGKGGRRTRKNNQNDDDDDDDDEDSKQKRKRKAKKNKKNKSAKKTRKSGKKGKKFGKSTRKGGSGAEEKKKKKKKSKGCRHPDGADRLQGHFLTAKVSGAVPCFHIHCVPQGKKFKWMYEETKCKTCQVGDVQYMVGYVSEQKCYGPPPCHIMMCMEDGQFRKQGWPCEDHTYFGQTTVEPSKIRRVYFKAVWKSKTWKSGYSNTAHSDFKSLDSSLQSSIKSAGLKHYHKSKIVKAYKGSTGTKGYIECKGTGTICTHTEVTTAVTKAGGSSVSAADTSYTSSTIAATTVG